MPETTLQSSSDHPPADALVTVDGTTIFGSGVAGDPLRAAGAGGEVVTDDTLTGNGTSGDPLGVVAGEISVTTDATLTGDGMEGSPLAVAIPVIAVANVLANGTPTYDAGVFSCAKTAVGHYTVILNLAAAAVARAIPNVTASLLEASLRTSAVVGTVGGRVEVLVQLFNNAENPIDSPFYLTVALGPA